MLTCKGHGVVSWTYQIQREDKPIAEIEFRFPSSHYEIRFEGVALDVVLDAHTGETQLLEAGEWLATARDVSDLLATYELQTEHHSLVLEQNSALSHDRQLLKDGHKVGIIAPQFSGSLDASMEIQDEVPLLLQVFAFAVTALDWRNVRLAPRAD